MPGHLEQMLQLHKRFRHKLVFIFQVAVISSSPSPPPPLLNPQAYAGISQGLTAFCFLISEFVPLAKQMFIIPQHKPGLGRGGVQLTSAYFNMH